MQTEQEGPADDLHVIIENIQDQEGDIWLACFDNPGDWMNMDKWFRRDRKPCPKNGNTTDFKFPMLPHGTYACCAMIDRNNNQKMDFNIVGYPLEPFAFSNGAEGGFGPPDFFTAAFVHNGKTCIRISLR
jgi:uncharacterized protein (DUF2141 family)